MLARKKEKRRVSMRMCERDGAATGERAGERGQETDGAGELPARDAWLCAASIE